MVSEVEKAEGRLSCVHCIVVQSTCASVLFPFSFVSFFLSCLIFNFSLPFPRSPLLFSFLILEFQTSD